MPIDPLPTTGTPEAFLDAMRRSADQINKESLKMQTNMVLRVYPLETKPDEIDHTRVGVNMPVGAKICQVIVNGQDFGVACFVPETATTRIWHPMVVAVMDQPVLAPTIGRYFGEVIGLFPLGGAPAVLVAELPWPESSLEAVVTKGIA